MKLFRFSLQRNDKQVARIASESKRNGWFIWGEQRLKLKSAVKDGDNMAIYACSSCHDVIDGRDSYNSLANPNLQEDCLRALEETQEQFIDEGLMVIL